jgi:hypothetical protein
MNALDEAFPTHDIDDPIVHARDAVHINGGDLRAALERLPSDLAHYGFEFARAHRRFLAAKLKLDEIKSSMYLECRESLESLGSKVTEALIEASVSKLRPVREARAELVEAEFQREQSRGMVEALRAKREAMTSLALLARAEMAGSGGFRDPAE